MAADAAADGRELLICPSCQAVFRTGYRACPHDGTRLMATTTDPLIGAELAGRYVVEALLGDGGLGRVYRARHARMSRRYALKVLYGDVAYDPKVRMRFANEAEAASRLSHPNVVGVVDFGETEAGLLYLAMDLAEGSSLADVIVEHGRLPPYQAVRLFREITLGLAHAHERGLVHRDLKPENIIIERRGGQPRIVDFGLALLQEQQQGGRVTTGGMVIGTPHYMAPEQATGETIDQRTDLFSLGLVLYEMLAGVLPFEGPALEVARMNLTVPPPTFAARVPGLVIDPAVEALVMKLLAKRPKDRPESAQAVLTMIDRLELPDAELDQKLTWVDGASGKTVPVLADPLGATDDAAGAGASAGAVIAAEDVELGEALPGDPAARTVDPTGATAMAIPRATPPAASALPARPVALDDPRRPLTTQELVETVRDRRLPVTVALLAIGALAIAVIAWRLIRDPSSSRAAVPPPRDAETAQPMIADAGPLLDAGPVSDGAIDDGAAADGAIADAPPADASTRGADARLADARGPVDAAPLPVDAPRPRPVDAGLLPPPMDAAPRRLPVDAGPVPAAITEGEVKTAYRKVGRAIDALEAAGHADAAARLRQRWLDLPYLDAVSKPAVRAEFMTRLRALEADVARAP